jgi:hypothetical protein
MQSFLPFCYSAFLSFCPSSLFVFQPFCVFVRLCVFGIFNIIIHSLPGWMLTYKYLCLRLCTVCLPATSPAFVIVLLLACPAFYLSASWPVRLPSCPVACLSSWLPVHWTACPLACLSSCSLTCLSSGLPVRFTVCPLPCLSAGLPVCLPACLVACLSVCLPFRLPVFWDHPSAPPPPPGTHSIIPLGMGIQVEIDLVYLVFLLLATCDILGSQCNNPGSLKSIFPHWYQPVQSRIPAKCLDRNISAMIPTSAIQDFSKLVFEQRYIRTHTNYWNNPGENRSWSFQ